MKEKTNTMKLWPGLVGFGKELALPGGGSLFYYDVPVATKSKPAFILIHGLGDEADTWRRVIPGLNAGGFRVLAPDLPGFGRSPAVGKPGIPGHTAAVTALARASGAGSVVLAGNSMGALVAQKAALELPGMVKTLVLINGCFPLSGKPKPGLLLTALPFLGKRWYRAFRKNHEKAWNTLYPYYANLDALKEEDRVFLRERVIVRVENGNQERGYFASLRSMIRLSLMGRTAFIRRFASYTGKILMLWGSEDRIIPMGNTAAFRSLYPRTEFREIAGAGHLPQQEKPEEVIKELLAVLLTY
jgi:pimeloyl-ACP methyl ester carboxylesterase